MANIFDDEEKVNDSTRYMKAPRSSNRAIIWIALVAALVIIAAVAAYLFLSGPSLKIKKGAQLKFEDMKKMAAKVDKIEQQIKKKQNEVFELIKTAKAQGVEIPPEIYQSMDLGPEEVKALEERLEKEEDVSYKGLLKSIVEKEKDIQKMKEELANIEKKLPRPVVVKRGDTHMKIAMDFLTKQYNLPPDKASKLISRVNIFDYLVPGFKVWNFYDPEADVFGTFVTQGDAPISPNEIKRRKKQELVSAKEKAEKKAEQLAQVKKSLEAQVAELESRKKQLQEDVVMLQEERNRLSRQLAELSSRVADLESRLNSVWYAVGTKAQLKKAGIIKGGFLTSTKIKNLSPSLFPNRLDLRNSTIIVLKASDFGVPKIKGAWILPKDFYQLGVDYMVIPSPDGQQIQIQILKPEKFKNNKIVIVLK